VSSILKALRKLEEEKAALGAGGVDIARDILKRSSSRRLKNQSLGIIAALFLGAFAATGVGLWILFSPANSDLSQQAEKTFDPKPSTLSSAEISSNQLPGPATPGTELSSPLPVLPTSKPETTAFADVTTTVLPRQSSPPEPAARTAAGLPYLQLSGIAYRQNPAERIAILNDLPVMQGTSIEGAQVIDILPDRVVMQWQGQEFQLRLKSE
jgi:general secretion pathway protein B